MIPMKPLGSGMPFRPRRRYGALLASLSVAFGLACGPRLLAQTLAQIHTPLGDLLVELYDQDKPVTVQNFLSYVQSGRYQDMIIHRWAPGFVIQGGGFMVTNRFTADQTIAAIPTFGTITNEYGVGRKFSNTFGTIAMARTSGGTNSATSQWFINLKDNSFLDAVDGGFTVFGHVVAGTGLLPRFNNVSATNGIFQAQLQAPLNELPVLAANNASYNDLVYAAISVPARPRLGIQLKSGGTKEISWNSLSNLVNYLEMSSSLPPNWQVLDNRKGTGNAMSFPDPAPFNRQRCYRLRVE